MLSLLDLGVSPQASSAFLNAAWTRWTGHTLADSGDATVVLVGPGASDDDLDAIVSGRRHPILFALTDGALLSASATDAAGVLLKDPFPRHDVRIRPTGFALLGRDDIDVTTRWSPATPTAPDVQVVATANVAFTDHPLLTWRPSTGVGVLTAGDPALWESPEVLRMVARWVRVATDAPAIAAQGVGLLAYGAIGAEHAEAVQAVPGLTLVAACDRVPDRLRDVELRFPSARTTTDADDLLADDAVDVVVVSTPPDTHAAWAARALAAGKHVVLEKPMALTAAECDELMATAEAADRVLVVYQNRRFDPDFVTLRSLVQQGSIGDVFHMETFVGGFGHPCNYWHSHAAVSGGAIFDWGSHLIDQILQVMPGEIESITARNHKRRWFDVTNADHARVTLHYANDEEAEFVFSDLAAVAKPKYYVLGTEGGIVGDWRADVLVERTSIGTARIEPFAPADSPADLTLVDSRGSRTSVALQHARPHRFHLDLAARLVEGLPMEVSAEESRRVVAVMEAAEASAAAGGRAVTPS